MSVYQINYHLPKQRDYSSLIESIQPYGAWCLSLKSAWIIVTE